MKTLKSLTLATLAIAFAFTSPVFGQGGRGGGTRLIKLNSPQKTTASRTVSMMSCPTETRMVVDHAGGRGAFKKVSVSTAHLCPSCTSKEVVTGVGKSAVRKVVHSCKLATTCCTVKS